jgi:hypothetical protein
MSHLEAAQSPRDLPMDGVIGRGRTSAHWLPIDEQTIGYAPLQVGVTV